MYVFVGDESSSSSSSSPPSVDLAASAAAGAGVEGGGGERPQTEELSASSANYVTLTENDDISNGVAGEFIMAALCNRAGHYIFAL